MQLVNVNPIQAKPPQASFAGRLQMFAFSIFDPSIRARPIESTLCRDKQAFRVRMQCLGYDLLAHTGTVGIRGVDEVDPQLHRTSQDSDGLGPVRGLTPDSFTRYSHCAESQSRDAQVVSNLELAGLACEFFFLTCH